MALRALMYSKIPETTSSLASVFEYVGLHADVCGDVFTAIDKGSKQPYACVIVDWADQPEAGFLLKRTRESGLNRNVVAIAVVSNEPASLDMREHRLDFLIYRPIQEAEAVAVLSKACQQMQVHSAAMEMETPGRMEKFEGAETAGTPEDPNLISVTAAVPRRQPGAEPEDLAEDLRGESDAADEQDSEDFVPLRTGRAFPIRKVLAGVLVLTAVACLWRSREAIQYLSRSREGVVRVLRESVAALLFTNKSGAQPVGSVVADAQQDAYFARGSPNKGAPPSLSVVATESDVPETYVRLPKAFDFPLPTPEFTPEPLPPVHVGRAAVPESLRGSLPIGPPVVATSPAQIMPVSVPVPASPQPFSEPVRLSEEAARALLVHTVDPAYPPEAAAQKLQGSVVLAAVIGRDGSVEDLKMVRGYFVLARAAIAAVKQWRFQPYTVNGRPARTETTITINFPPPRG